MLTKLIFFLAFVITFLIPCKTYSQSNYWAQTSGPGGGAIRCFVKNHTNRWLIGTSGNGVYYTTNEGQDWITANAGLTNAKINGLVLDSANLLYAGTERGLFRTTMVGDWTNIAFNTSVIYSIFVNADNKLFVSATNTIWMSTDNGVNWNISGGGLPNSTYYNLCASPNSNLYVSSSAGVYRSTDGGANWTAVNLGLPSTFVSALCSAPNNYLFAGISSSGIYLSTNNGDNWTAVNSGLGNMYIYGFGAYGTMIFAGSGNGIYKSTNYGSNWTTVNSGFPSPYTGSRSFGFVSGSVVFAGTDAIGVLKSTDGGNSWSKSSNGINCTAVKSIDVSPNGTVFVGFTGGVYSTSNGGANFIPADSGITNTMNNVIKVHPNGYIFAGTFPLSNTPLSGIYRSTNNGVSWTVAMSGFTYQYNNVLDLAFNSTGHIYAATNDNVYKSTNLGNNWVKFSNGVTNSQVYSIAVNQLDNVFAGTYGSGIFRTRDNGLNWMQINNGLTATQIMSLAINANGEIFAGANGQGVYRSTDSGDSWVQVLGLGGMTLQAWKVAINRKGYIYAGIVGGQNVNLGVWMSTNNGDNWTQLSGGIFYPFVDAIAFDSTGFAYAGTLGGGLYKSTISTPVNNNNIAVPKKYLLEQNFPNPFNPTTGIRYSIPVGGFVSLKIYNILGNEIETLVSSYQPAGNYQIMFDGSRLSSGAYFYVLQSGDYRETKRMLLVK